MNERLMLLPSRDCATMHLLRIPHDYGSHEALRHATALIAKAQETDTDVSWEVIADQLADEGFTQVDFIIGPTVDW